ncbi:zinc-binding dehydrogenase [Nocardia sp. NPDC057353]|uniref:zinc-binding dehydrogenase n=1 Tax=Nocardia sp. NPDC057353 TaxID=3346104 RepID=UPI003626D838
MIAAGFLDSRPTPDPEVTVQPYRSFEHTLDPVVAERMAAFLEAGIRDGEPGPVIDSVLPLDAVVQAHHRLEEGAHTGKIVVLA